MVKTVLKLSVLLMFAFCSTSGFGQYKPQAATYSNFDQNLKKSQSRITVKLTKAASGNYSVAGVIITRDTQGAQRDRIAFTGTLYLAGHLRARVVSPAKFNTWTIDGNFQASTGKLLLNLKYPQKYEGQNRPGYYIKNYQLTSSASEKDVDVFWVLKDGFPDYDATYSQTARPFSVYGAGTMVWPATSMKDGKPISQTFTFTVPKKEYKHGEKFMVTVDGSGTEKGAYPYVMCVMYYGWRSGGWTGMGNDNSQYNIQVGFKQSGEVVFDPSSESQAFILVGAPGMGGMRWEYKRVERPRK